MMNHDPIAIVQQAELTETQIIDAAKELADRTNADAWEIGRLASLWTQQYSRGRTDEVFANKIGMSRHSVSQRRRVWETFSDLRKCYPGITFTHFRQALAWPNAEECLAWANENNASWREMDAWNNQAPDEESSNPVSNFDDDAQDDLQAEAQSIGFDDPGPEPDDINDADPHQPAKPPVIVPRDIPTMGELLKALKGVCDGWTPTDDRERTNTAKKLRALANQIDPPTPTKTNAKFTPPRMSDVVDYCRERKNSVNAEQWFDHYTANGWKVGKNQMKDWQASIRTWERGDNGTPKTSSGVYHNPATEFDPSTVGRSL